jgi:hypothetical protein
MVDATEGDLKLLIGRLDGKLDLLLDFREGQERRVANVEAKVEALSAWKNKLIGIVAGISGASAALAHLDLTRLFTILK